MPDLMPIAELRSLIDIERNGHFRYVYNDAEIVLATYFRGLITKAEVYEYYGIVFPNGDIPPQYQF